MTQSTTSAAPPRWSPRLLWRPRAGRPRLPLLSAALCILLIFAAVAGGMITPFAPDNFDFTAVLAPPFWMEGGSTAHLLGADQLGRDMLSRLIAGARVSLLTAGAAVLIAGSIGVLLGLVAGYLGGLVEAAIMRVVDAFLALPFILMALAFVSALGTGIGNIILVMILTNWARYARLVRSEVVSIKKRDFVLLARVAGVRPMMIALRHVLPNAMTSVMVLAVLDIGRAIILEILTLLSRPRYPAAGCILGPRLGGRTHLHECRLVAHGLAGCRDRARGDELQSGRGLAACPLRSSWHAVGPAWTVNPCPPF